MGSDSCLALHGLKKKKNVKKPLVQSIYGSVQFKVVSVLCVEKPISCTVSLTRSPHTFETVPVFS